MEQIYFIPINSGSLAHYLSRALILPSKYLQNKPEDIQNKLDHSILLTKNKWVKNSDCSIEVVLTTDEENETVNLTNNFFQLNIPLPISRIKKIHFLDEKQMETTVWNINNGAAFIPQHLIALASKTSVEIADDNFIPKETSSNSNGEIEKKISRFDTALGGFAFMKVGGKHFGIVSADFSENYFITLSTFNKLIEEQTLKVEKEKDLNFNRKYIGLFSTNNSEWSKWQPYIYKNIELQEVEEIAEKEGVKIEKKLGLLNIDSIDKQTHLYDIAILATYGDRKNKSIDDLVNSLHNGVISENKVEDIVILFGLNTGYTKFRNKYKVSNKDYNVKFKLDSKLDYYTIESIYQFSFHNNRNNSKIEFIDKLDFPKTKNTKITGFETYTILDKTVVAKKKQTPLELFLGKYANGIYEKLSQSAKQFIPAYATFDKEKAIDYFKNLLNDSFVTAIKQFEKEILAENEELFNDEKQSLISLYEEKIEFLRNEINNIKNTKFETGAINTFSIESEIKETSVVCEPSVFTNLYKDYEKMSLSELKEEAKKKGIKGLTKYKKNDDRKDLIDLINNSPTLHL
jgi:hypothetical protein